MAVNEGDSIKSFDNIPAIIEAQKRATQLAGETFWNSYEAMGGKHSIIKWADKKPPLAQKDFVHFTYPGADTLSKLLVASLFTVRQDTAISQILCLAVPGIFSIDRSQISVCTLISSSKLTSLTLTERSVKKILPEASDCRRSELH